MLAGQLIPELRAYDAALADDKPQEPKTEPPCVVCGGSVRVQWIAGGYETTEPCPKCAASPVEKP